jgi:hypothetical protein
MAPSRRVHLESRNYQFRIPTLRNPGWLLRIFLLQIKEAIMNTKLALAIALALASGNAVYAAGSQSDSSAVSGAEAATGDMHPRLHQNRTGGDMKHDMQQFVAEQDKKYGGMESAKNKPAGEDTNASGGGNLSGATESMSDRSPEG